MELSRIALLLAKLETTYGTDPIPTAAANCLAVVGVPTLKPVYERVDRQFADGGLGKRPGFNTVKTWQLDFRMELRGNGSIQSGLIANAVELDPLLQACNLVATYTAGTGVTYKPSPLTTNGPSVTFYFYSALKKHSLVGCKGTFKISWQAGKMAFIDFSFKGLQRIIVDATFPTGQTFGDTMPPLLVSSSIVIGSYGPVLSKCDFDLGNDIQPQLDANSPNGVKGFVIAGRDSKLTLDPESVAEATHPFWAYWNADQVETVTVPIGGAVSGNIITFTAVSQMTDISYSDRNNQRVHSAQATCVRNSQADALGSEVQLAFS